MTVSPDRDVRRGLAEGLGSELTGLVKLIDRASAHAAIAKFGGVDRAAYALLGVLVTRGPQRSKTLAQLVRSDPSTVSRQIASLVGAGLVERTLDPGDGRAAVLAATEHGRRTFEANRERRTRHLLTLTEHWSDDDLARLHELVARLRADIDHDLSRPEPAPAATAPADVTTGSVLEDTAP